MNYDWKAAVRGAQTSKARSSGQLSGFRNIKFWRDGNKWMFQDERRSSHEITEWKEIPVDTIHFKPIGTPVYAKLNARDEAVVRALTKSIMRGDVKITGPHRCVNNLGDPPVQGCKEITPTVPVPIKVGEGELIYANIKVVKVTRGSSWNMYAAFVEESTDSGGDREEMEVGRVYMCGGL